MLDRLAFARHVCVCVVVGVCVCVYVCRCVCSYVMQSFKASISELSSAAQFDEAFRVFIVHCAQ